VWIRLSEVWYLQCRFADNVDKYSLFWCHHVKWVNVMKGETHIDHLGIRRYRSSE